MPIFRGASGRWALLRPPPFASPHCAHWQALAELQALGYAVVCWTTEAGGGSVPKPAKPLPPLRPHRPPGGGGGGDAALSSFTRPVHECSRLTVSLEEESHAFALAGAREALRSYDVVAVAPGSEAVLERVLTSPARELIDLVCLPSAHTPPFSLRPHAARRVLAAGLQLELCYSAALRDAASRRHFFANLRACLEALPGAARKRGAAGLVLSSGADEPRLLREPRDVASLVSLVGAGPLAGRAALAVNPFRALERAARRQYPPPLAPPPPHGLCSIGLVPTRAAAAVAAASAGGGASGAGGEQQHHHHQKRKRRR